jgi:hypothetical protein
VDEHFGDVPAVGLVVRLGEDDLDGAADAGVVRRNEDGTAARFDLREKGSMKPIDARPSTQSTRTSARSSTCFGSRQ